MTKRPDGAATGEAARRPSAEPTVIGWREWVGLPDLGIGRIKAKIDSGARTAALHALDIQPFEREEATWVRFGAPGPDHRHRLADCEAIVHDRRPIKNTSGRAEDRFIILTTLLIDGRRWRIEVSLANREQMGFDLILGRTAVRRRNLLINPGRSFLTSRPRRVRPIKNSASELERLP